MLNTVRQVCNNLHSNSEYIVVLCPATPLYLAGDCGPAQDFRTMATRLKGDARRFPTFDEARDVSAAVNGWVGSRVEDVAKALPPVTANDLRAAAYRALEAALATADARRDRDQAVAFLFYSVRDPKATVEARYASNSSANRRLQDKTERWELAEAAQRVADQEYQDLSKRSNDQSLAALAASDAREGGGA
jgi:hypothetical protein